MKNAQRKSTLLIVVLITALSQAAVALYLPALPDIATALHTTTDIMKWSISSYLLGIAIAQLIYGPLSDVIGRKYPLLIGLSLFIVGCIMAILAEHPQTLIIARCVQGLGAGSTITLGRSILRDTYQNHELANAMAFLSMAFAIGLGISPLIGSYLEVHIGWRADFMILATFSFLLILSIGLFFRPISKSTYTGFGNVKTLLKNKTYWAYATITMLSYCIIITYCIMSPFLIEKIWHFSPTHYAIITMFIGFAYFSGSFLNSRIVHRLGVNAMIKSGILLLLLCSSILIFVSYTSTFSQIILISALVFAAFAQGLMFSNTLAGALMSCKEQAGTASSLLTFCQILFAATFSSMIAMIPIHHAISIGAVLLGLSLLLILFSQRLPKLQI